MGLGSNEYLKPKTAEMSSFLGQTSYTLHVRKHVYSNILEISPPKTEKFSDKNSDFFFFFFFFHISAKNIDFWYLLELPCQGGSKEYPQSMFTSRNKKNNVYFCKP